MAKNGLTQFRTVLPKRENLSNGQVLTLRLPSQYGYVAMELRLDGVVAGSGGTVSDDGINAVVERVTLRTNSRPVWSLPWNDEVARQTYLFGTAASFTQVTAGSSSPVSTMIIPFSLPRPAKSPGRHASMLPAGLINNIDLEITVASSILGALFSTVGSQTLTSMILSVTLICLDLTANEQMKMVEEAGYAYVQLEYQMTISAAGTFDTQLQGGRGALIDLFRRNILAGTGSNAFTTDERLLVGNNDFPMDARFLELQGWAKSFYGVESPPAGTYVHPFNQDGELNQGISLVGEPTVFARATFAAPSGTSNSSVISGVLDPGFYKEVIGL